MLILHLYGMMMASLLLAALVLARRKPSSALVRLVNQANDLSRSNKGLQRRKEVLLNFARLNFLLFALVLCAQLTIYLSEVVPDLKWLRKQLHQVQEIQTILWLMAAGFAFAWLLIRKYTSGLDLQNLIADQQQANFAATILGEIPEEFKVQLVNKLLPPAKQECQRLCGKKINLVRNEMDIYEQLINDVKQFDWCDICKGESVEEEALPDPQNEQERELVELTRWYRSVCKRQCGRRFCQFSSARGREANKRLLSLKQKIV